MITYTAVSNGQGYGVHLAPGYYPCRIHNAEEKTSSKGNDQVALTLYVGDQRGLEIVNEYLTFSEKALWKIDQFCYAIGDDPTPGKSIVIDATMLIGRTCWVKTREEEIETRNGNRVTVSKVDHFLRRDQVPVGDPEPVRQQAPVQPSAPVGMPHESDDDIPF